MPLIDHLAAFAAKLARMSGTTESSVPATAHPLVQTDGSATTVLMEAKATTSGPDATSLQGTFEHEPKLDVFAGTHHAYTQPVCATCGGTYNSPIHAACFGELGMSMGSDE